MILNRKRRALARGVAMFVASLFGTPAFGAPVNQAEVDLAQSEMLRRIMDAVALYARSINIGNDYVNYCYQELHLKTEGHPANGSIPFGINYRQITDSDRLAQVLSVREAYEKSFLTICLANAKNALRDANVR